MDVPRLKVLLVSPVVKFVSAGILNVIGNSAENKVKSWFRQLKDELPSAVLLMTNPTYLEKVVVVPPSLI